MQNMEFFRGYHLYARSSDGIKHSTAGPEVSQGSKAKPFFMRAHETIAMAVSFSTKRKP